MRSVKVRVSRWILMNLISSLKDLINQSSLRSDMLPSIVLIRLCEEVKRTDELWDPWESEINVLMIISFCLFFIGFSKVRFLSKLKKTCFYSPIQWMAGWITKTLRPNRGPIPINSKVHKVWVYTIIIHTESFRNLRCANFSCRNLHSNKIQNLPPYVFNKLSRLRQL